jgi:hypothetical protein
MAHPKKNWALLFGLTAGPLHPLAGAVGNQRQGSTAVSGLNVVGTLHEPATISLWDVAFSCCMAVLGIQDLVKLIGRRGKMWHLA